jgi:hypothetical protein
MRKLLLATLLGLTLSANVGCFIPAYSGDPIRRTRQLIYTSENLRMINDEWERIWFLDMPATTGPYRVHGGVI